MNALKLEEQKGRGKEYYDKKCKLCGEEDEDMVHFIVKCKYLEEKRDHALLDTETRDPEEKMRILLFRNDRRQDIGKMIRSLWELRRKQLKKREEEINTINTQSRQLTTQGCINKKKEKTKQLPKPTTQNNSINRGKTPQKVEKTTQGCNRNREETLKITQRATQGCRKSKRL